MLAQVEVLVERLIERDHHDVGDPSTAEEDGRAESQRRCVPERFAKRKRHVQIPPASHERIRSPDDALVEEASGCRTHREAVVSTWSEKMIKESSYVLQARQGTKVPPRIP